MISIEKLTKVYKSKKGAPTTALDQISFDLPDKGMVFILGKSGSGKSTLLNLLGGLDSITSGDIVACGNRFSNFTDEDYDNYRNSFVGFIFQDFCLIESFTVRENIMLALNLGGQNDESKLFDVAERLDIEDLLDRLPKELSGGQRQRVAIARAIIKNPGMILADEPTGNLDSASAKQVLDTLKDISKDNLVLIVSHNPDDAEKYGDRIIEIADGKVINDHIKNESASFGVSFDGNHIVLPCNVSIEEGDLEKINAKVKDSGVQFKLGTRLFSKTPQVVDDNRQFKLSPSKLSFKKMKDISINFLKSKWVGFLVSVLMSSAIIIMFGLCQLFASFSAETTMEKAIKGTDNQVFVMQKAYKSQDGFEELITSGTMEIKDEEMDKFRQAGYQGQIYPLLNYCFALLHQDFILESHQVPENKKNYQQFFARETMGLLVCNEEFLTKIYGINGKLEYVAMSNNPQPYGLILTDYQADSMMAHYPAIYRTYDDVLERTEMANRGYVNAVIKTGYNERYKDVKEKFVEAYKNRDLAALAKVRSSEEYINFLDELNTFLNVAYTFNPNFIEDAAVGECRDFACVRGMEVTVDAGGQKIIYDNPRYFYYGSRHGQPNLAPDEIMLSIEMYNGLFGTTILTPTDPGIVTGQVITCDFYPVNYEGEKEIMHSRQLKVVGVTAKPYSIVSDAYASELRKYEIYPYALYFDNGDMSYSIYTTGAKMNFAPTSAYFKAILEINDIVEVFKKLFVLIAVFLCFAGGLVLLSFGSSSVKKRNFEVGVIRAIGGNTKNIAMIFTMQILLAGIIICVISSVGLYVTSIVANKILANSFVALFESTALASIEVVHFNPLALVLDLAVVLAITLLAAVLPILSIRKIKPLKILRAKE